MRNTPKKIKYIEEIKEILDKFTLFNIDSISSNEIVRFIKSIHRSFNNNSKLPHISNYIGVPDLKDPILQDGWIDINGNWYSCESGAHEIKAQMIICFNNNLTNNYLDTHEINNNIYSLIFMDRKPVPSDYLISKGWLKIQNIYKPSVVYALGKKLSKNQINTIYKAVEVFDLNSDPLEHSQIIDYNDNKSLNA
ncbi:MAG: hypothetical protein ABF289_09890 [Clostridiales bacterium]